MADEADEEAVSRLAALASGDDTAEDSPEPSADESDEQDDAEDDESVGLKDILFSTEPNLKPQEVAEDQGVELYEAHGYVALRKMIRGMGFDLGGEGTGTPAIYNLAQFVRGARDAQKDDQEGEDEGGADAVQDETPDVAQEFT